MSLEAAIAELTDAIKENTAVQREAIAGRSEVLAAAKEAVASRTSTPKASTKKSDEPKPDAPAAETAVPTLQDVNNAITGYANGSSRQEEIVARSEKVLEIIKKVAPEGTEKFNGAAVPEDKRQLFIDTLNDFCTRPDLTQSPADNGAGGLLG